MFVVNGHVVAHVGGSGFGNSGHVTKITAVMVSLLLLTHEM